ETGLRGLPRSASHAAFAADGQYAFADGKNVTLCSADGKKTREFPAAESRLAALALSPDGALLAARSVDHSVVHLWDTKAMQGRPLAPAGNDPRGGGNVVTETTGVVVPDLVFTPDGRFLAGGGPGPLGLWDVGTGHLLWALDSQAGQAIERFAFSANGLHLAA